MVAVEQKRTLRDHELGERVESGTHSVVYRAKRRGAQRSVLIKTLKPGLRPNAELRAALRRERRLLDESDHPALPAVIDAWDDEEVLALVYLDRRGHRLDRVLERHSRVPTTTALAIALELCGPLAALHRLGHAHGSLRAEVVELTAGGGVFLHGVGVPEAPGDDLQMLPEHMAPEQLLGEAPEPATDIFALGALLYRMIAGRPAFEPSEGAISQSIRHAAPPSLATVDEEVLPAVDKLVLRCLEKRPEDRYPDVASVASALGRALAAEALPTWVLVSRALARAGLGEELAAPRERAPRLRSAWRAPRWLRRARRPLALAAALVTAAAIAWLALRDPDASTAGDSRAALERSAHLRVLAHPWAEVHIDGELVDVTPIGTPIRLRAGAHEVVFKHPHAPDEHRSIQIAEGQTLVLDVEMRIERARDAGAPAPPVASEDDSP